MLDTYLGSCKDVQHLKTGGQREVYRGRHPKFGDVVIKHSQTRSLAGLERLIREVQFLKDVESDCFPKLHEFILEPAAKECLVVEQFISGKELSNCKEEYTSEQKIINLLKMLIKCLSGVWDSRVVHRDLKPDNILIQENGCPIVLDFGIARFLDDCSLTKTLAAMGPGTPIYAAPEQLANQKSNISIRTDFFALGLMAFELLIKNHPFSTDLVGGESIPNNIVDGRYVDPATQDISKQFRDLISMLLQVQPFMRPRTHKILQGFLNENWS